MDNVTGSEYVCQDEAANPSPGWRCFSVAGRARKNEIDSVERDCVWILCALLRSASELWL